METDWFEEEIRAQYDFLILDDKESTSNKDEKNASEKVKPKERTYLGMDEDVVVVDDDFSEPPTKPLPKMVRGRLLRRTDVECQPGRSTANYDAEITKSIREVSGLGHSNVVIERMIKRDWDSPSTSQGEQDKQQPRKPSNMPDIRFKFD